MRFARAASELLKDDLALSATRNSDSSVLDFSDRQMLITISTVRSISREKNKRTDRRETKSEPLIFTNFNGGHIAVDTPTARANITGLQQSSFLKVSISFIFPCWCRFSLHQSVLGTSFQPYLLHSPAKFKSRAGRGVCQYSLLQYT